MSPKQTGTLALIGGGEWREGCRELDAELLARAGAKEVVVLPTAAAFEHPGRVVERAVAYFANLDASVRPLEVLRRSAAGGRAPGEKPCHAPPFYLAAGSPPHLPPAP